MLGSLLQAIRPANFSSDLVPSQLLNEETFYPALLKDLKHCQCEAVIESPFVTKRRLLMLIPVLRKLKEQRVRIVINTRDPRDNENEHCREDALAALSELQHLGVQVVYTRGHHRKLVIIDRKVLYEGSLNVLSQNDSREVMRRIESVSLAWEMVRFVGADDRV
jgi:phosphatidylserine/phosphatidylglycerophosphate/cardiolipin synthase-like enzyme